MRFVNAVSCGYVFTNAQKPMKNIRMASFNSYTHFDMVVINKNIESSKTIYHLYPGCHLLFLSLTKGAGALERTLYWQ